VSAHQEEVLPVGGDADLQPWTDDDVSALRPGVEVTCVMAYDAAVELQQQPQQRPDYSNPVHIMEQMVSASMCMLGVISMHGKSHCPFWDGKVGALMEWPLGAESHLQCRHPTSRLHHARDATRNWCVTVRP
jgi:hypothetical protein